MQIIDGKKISQEIKDEVKEEVAKLKAEGKDIALAVIQVGADPASSVYVRNKKRACEYVGIESISYELPEETTQEELMAIVDKCNKDPKINGILVQLPLPKHLDEDEVLLAIDPKKLGRPEGFDITIREIYVNAGAGFLVALTGDVMTMPGLPKKPAAEGIDVNDDGVITGLF